MNINIIIGFIFLLITIILLIYKLITKNKNKILLIIIIISSIISLLSFLYVLLLYLDNNVLTKKEREAICSNSDTLVIYLDESNKNTHIKEISHAKSTNLNLNNRLCEYAKEVAYYYDREAIIECNGNDYNSSYFRNETFDKVIEYYENNNYKCMIFNNDLKENRDIILGNWCNDNIKYQFNEDGTMIEYMDNISINGYYSFNGEYLDIAYKYQNYYIIILKQTLSYNKEDNSLVKNNDVFTKCEE